MSVGDDLRELLAAWVPVQRWFGGKGRPHALTVTRLAELAPSPQVTLWTADVDYGDGEIETYQVPLVARDQPVAALEHALVGTIDTDGGPRWVYDALHDKDATPAWLAGLRDGGAGGPVRFVRYVDAGQIPVDRPSLVLAGEQSNTSMIFGDEAIMKVFRRLQPGVNPDIEVQSRLSELGAANVAQLLGTVEADVFGEPTSLAFVQEYMASAVDGWGLATASVRDLMAEADLHAAEAGGDFAGEAQRLGEAVAAVHADLASAFGTEQPQPQLARTRAAAMRVRLESAVAVVPALAPLAGGLAAIYDAVGTGQAAELPLQRIHGDLHLGQTLRTVTRWVLIDFEGEPMATMAQRRAFDSPLRDVAGMLRSFEYAGHHRVIDGAYDQQLGYRAAQWTDRNRSAFLDGYAAARGSDPREHDLLLQAYEADKAVYEAVYEARNRPAWLAIPLATLTRLASGGAA